VSQKPIPEVYDRGRLINFLESDAGFLTASAPGGSDTQVQYNDAGSFGGSTNFKWTGTAVEITGAVVVNSGDKGLHISGTVNATLLDITYDGAGASSPALTVTGNNVGIGVSDPDCALEIFAGSGNQLKLSENGTDNTTFDHRNEVLTISVDGGGNAMFMDTKGLQVGKATFGVNSPKTAFEVHFSGAEGNLDPAKPGNLADNEGGGEVIYFGVEAGGTTLTAGKMYYLNASGIWAETNASATGSGGDQLLAISLGTEATASGMLMRGFFDAHSYLTGTFTPGKPVYVCPTAGHMDAAEPPAAAGDFVRVVGYCTTLPNVIYFNPSSTYVEIS